MQDSDKKWMSLALTLGRRGQGNTWPNPSVGCVIVKNDRVVGRGWTKPTGRPHAEVVALQQAKHHAQGATAYVTLEPCAHHGQTGPCAVALVKAGVSNVVVATVDPDPRVAGQGIQILRDAGVNVTVGVLRDDANIDHAGFLKRLSCGMPKLTLKLALSLDGKIATSTGESRWITGSHARRMVHADRLRHDAVMVGGGTARADNPTLTVRGFGAVAQPVRVIVSQHLAFEGQALKNDLPDAPVFLIHGHNADNDIQSDWKKSGAELFPVSDGQDGLDVIEVLQALGARGLTSVYCEGGGKLAASLLAADLVDDLIIYHAGVVIGADGVSGLGDLGLPILGDCPRFDLMDICRIGTDIRHLWQRKS